MVEIRVGIGQDSHVFESGKPLVLGGISIKSDSGCKGNSDGDVVLHALCNALSSAVGKGSISTYSDKMCLEQGIKDSREYVKVALGYIKKAGLKVNNISIAIEAKKPRLEECFPKIKSSIAKMLEVTEDCVGITATSGEGLTSFGKGRGMQAFAIVSVIKC